MKTVLLTQHCLMLFTGFEVMQVTVVDTGGAVVKDVVFPEVDALKGSKWEKNRDSIRLTSGAVKEFSIEG